MNGKKKNSTKQKLTRIGIFLVALAVTLMVSALAVFAAPVVKKAEYEGKGKVEVEFVKRVQYGNLKITVKDQSGKSYGVKIIDRDHDDVEFKIKNYKPGKTYTYKISGVKKAGESAYSTVKGKVKIPKSAGGIPISEVEYDFEDREVSIEFDTKVQWKKPKVTISDGTKNYVIRIDEYDRDEIEVKVTALKPGVTYTWKISGIRQKGTTSYKTISGTFKVN